MINSNRSERGWRGRRRIAVLVSALTLFGIAHLGSAGSASAAFTLCKGSVTAQSKSNPGNAAKVSFSCNGAVRAYGVSSNKTIASYGAPPLVSGAVLPFFDCEGAVPSAGFGCGIRDRALAIDGTGTQVPGPTPQGGSTTSCGRSTTVTPAGPMNSPPAINGITGPNCAQLIQPGSVVTQDVTLTGNPCKFKRTNPLRMFVMAAGEPPVSSFTIRGDSINVGAYMTEPFKLKVKGYKQCQEDAGGTEAKEKSAKAAAAGTDLYPMSCTGSVKSRDPAKPSIDMKYEFACARDIRGYAITSNLPLDFFGFESEVYKPDGSASATESALIQCEGPVPGFGFGCGITNRQNSGGCGPTPGNDPGEDLCQLSAFNRLVAELGVPENPCKRQKGEPRQRIWVTVFGEMPLPNEPGGTNAQGVKVTGTHGLYASEPFELPLLGYDPGSCAAVLKENDKKKGGEKKK